jgi:hypothetical protein
MAHVVTKLKNAPPCSLAITGSHGKHALARDPAFQAQPANIGTWEFLKL